jgi:predicted helicase
MADSTQDARIHYADLYGLRQHKYDWLNEHERTSTDWEDLEPQTPFYLFVPQDTALATDYQQFPSVPNVFPVNSVGIVTARDSLTIKWTAEEAWDTVTVFARMDEELARDAYNVGKDSRDWKVKLAQEDLRQTGPARENVVPILYRPFDVRHTYYTGRSRGFICRPRPEVMRHMLAGANVALVTARTNKSGTMDHFFSSPHVVEAKCGESTVQSYTFPLYLYPSAERDDLFAEQVPGEREPNLAPDVVAALEKAYGGQPTPEGIFHYVYAVLYAPTYREKYAEFLRMDFPRVPFTADADLFARLAALGERLVKLHLLDSPELDPPACKFEGEGNSVVQRTKSKVFRYDPDERRVYINTTQYFGPVPAEVYEYRIGGYQVCNKWLKDRKERRLDLDDTRTYCRIVTALGLTIQIQREIDRLYADLETDTLAISG